MNFNLKISRFSEMLKIKYSTNNDKVSFYLCVLNLLIYFTASLRLDSLVVVCLSSNQKNMNEENTALYGKQNVIKYSFIHVPLILPLILLLIKPLKPSAQ